MVKAQLIHVFTLILLLHQGTAAQEGRGDVRFLFYNVENLFDPFDDSLKLDDEFLPGGTRGWTWERFLEKERRIFKVLASAGGWTSPEIVGLCEVENRFVLGWLTGKTPLLKYNYRIIHRDSPDERGIDVALLYRQDKIDPLYTRFIPVGGLRDPGRDILYVTARIMERDTLHLMICHWPSRWDGYLESRPDRIAAAKLVRGILDSILQTDPKARILLAGDLNDELRDPSLSEVLRVQLPFSPVLDTCLYHTGGHSGRGMPGTIRYRGNWYEFDHILVSGAFLSDSCLFVRPGSRMVYAPSFLLEEDPDLPGVRPYRTYRGFTYHGGFSDHLPVYIDIWRGE